MGAMFFLHSGREFNEPGQRGGNAKHYTVEITAVYNYQHWYSLTEIERKTKLYSACEWKTSIINKLLFGC